MRDLVTHRTFSFLELSADHFSKLLELKILFSNWLIPHIAMWFFCFSCSIRLLRPPAASRVHHQHITINTTPSTHNTMNTTPSTSSTHHHRHNTINTSPSTHHHQHITINSTTSTHTHQQHTINTTPSTHHHPHFTIHTNHHHNTINTSPYTHHHSHNTINTTLLWVPPRFAWQAQHLEHLRLVCSFCMADAALGAPPACFAWQAQHLEHLRLAGAALGAPS